ncbi:MAG: hypothetical protein JW855_01685 [Gammaproteobacteria bacterium]|nr:hypothetical protein [Gammaproteobacteria bacterium]
MKKGDFLSLILRSPKTIFSFQDIALLWRESDRNTIQNRLSYYIENNKLVRIRKGIYAKDRNYDPLELATKIFTPSYISFETVLAQEGIIFQYYDQIFIASYLNRTITCDNHQLTFKKIKNTVLTCKKGLIQQRNYTIASKERAFLDILYLNKHYYFDNLNPIDWEKVWDLLPIYNNQALNKRINVLKAS